MLSPRTKSGTIDLLHAAILAGLSRFLPRRSSDLRFRNNQPSRVLSNRAGRRKLAIANWLRQLAGLSDLCWEVACPICQRSTAEALCKDCQQRLQCLRLPEPQQFWQPPLPIFAWGVYEGALKRAIATLKYERQPQLAQPLGDWLAQQWLAQPGLAASWLSGAKPLWVVPIPMHPDKQQQRGFNQAELLAKAFCQRTGLPLKSRGLVRNRLTEAQFSLAAAARTENLSGAFDLGADFLKPTRTAVLLLDDIYTTGATANAAAQTLRRHQISVHGIAVIAKTPAAKKP